MRLRQLVKYGIVATFSSLWGCTLLVDISDIDRHCKTDEKFCGGRCVLQNLPAYGCTSELCGPCDLNNAEQGCEGGVCVAKSCLYGFGCADCTAYILADERNCGVCGHICPATETCRNGECVGS
jgi:hypothetical protein